ncbi:MAG: hypothetical protein JSR85_08415, partial [Proteobacteria bacterium]|nr:hypothetical protein [Pseudomonadota bacterium]
SDIYAGVVHMGVDMAIPTDALGIGLTALPGVGPGVRGTRAVVQTGKQLVMGVERGLGRVLAVSAEAFEESQLLLGSIGKHVRALAGEVPSVSYAGEFGRATASSTARFEAKILSKTAAPPSAAGPTPTSVPFARPTVAPAPPLSATALESMEVGLKVKPKPVSALELGKRYDAERRAARKAAFLESAKAAKPKPTSVTSSAPPPSAAAQRLGKAVDASSFSPTSKIVPLDKKGRVMFDGVEFRAVRDLGHMSEEALRYMKNTGKNPHDLTHNPLVGHHHLQKYHRETGAFVAEIPGPKHDITHKVQHPYGNIKGSGLTDEERIDWNKLRKKFNKERAKQELIRRGVLDE